MVEDSAIGMLLTQSHMKASIPCPPGCEALELDRLDVSSETQATLKFACTPTASPMSSIPPAQQENQRGWACLTVPWRSMLRQQWDSFV